MSIPMELSLGGVYFPPILLAIILGALVSWVIVSLMQWRGYLRFVWNPPVFFLALSVICTWLVT